MALSVRHLQIILPITTDMLSKHKFIFVGSAIILLSAVGGLIYYSKIPLFYNYIEYGDEVKNIGASAKNSDSMTNLEGVKEEKILKNSSTQEEVPITHIKTPDQVKAIYASSWVAGLAKYRDPLIKLIDDTEINAIVIDVKDSTGRISFEVRDPTLLSYGSSDARITNIRSLVNMLHQKNIYVIGRVAVFQDPYMTKKKPEWSITRKNDGKVWKDNKGLSFLDPSNKAVWNYAVSIAREAESDGFDEINFDYIRYPSDGDIKNINYNLTKGKKRSDNLEEFFKYLSTELKAGNPVVMSADLFGLTTETLNQDDMGIGQVWEKALPYFDFLAPMVYPSHYPEGQGGFNNPSEHPYEIINKAMEGAVMKTTTAKYDIKKIRPWLQDFNLGANYTAEMIKKEIKALNDNGINSWMMWDPRNKYTAGAFAVEN